MEKKICVECKEKEAKYLNENFCYDCYKDFFKEEKDEQGQSS